MAIEHRREKIQLSMDMEKIKDNYIINRYILLGKGEGNGWKR